MTSSTRRVSARTRIAVAAGQATGALSRLAGRGAGATISGRVMNAISPGALAELADGHRVVLVSATNGKTTTNAMLSAALREAGHPVVTNATGANLTSGLAPVLAAATGPAIAALEVDERVLTRVVDPLRPELLVLGNLSRDQLDRYGEVHALAAAWREVATRHPQLHIVANASDPHVVWAASPARVTWVALGLRWRADAATCPECGALLAWDDVGFACPECRFGPPATTNRLVGDTLVLGDHQVALDLALPGTWNQANAALAITAAVDHFGIDAGTAAAAMARLTSVAGRYMAVPLGDGRTARVLLAKNPAGWTEVLEWLAARDASVVLAVNARIADGKDPSWLWDVPYELLAGKAVVASGDRHLDVAVRLHYAGVAHEIEADPLVAAQALPGDTVHLVCSYTQFHALYRRFGSGGPA